MKNGIENTLFKISEGAQNFAIWFVVNLPYLIIWAVILFGGFLGVRRWKKSYDKKNKFRETKYEEQRERIREQINKKENEADDRSEEINEKSDKE